MMSHSWIRYAVSVAAGTAFLSAGLIGLPASAAAATISNGTVVHVIHNPRYYIVENNTLHWIPNPQTFKALGLSWSQALTVTALPLSVSTPVTLVKHTSPDNSGSRTQVE